MVSGAHNLTSQVSSTQTKQLLDGLKSIVGEKSVLTSQAELRAYDCDAYTVDKARPTFVVLPETTEQVSEIVKLCNALNFPFVPRGAGTGLSGGSTAVYGGVVISTVRLNKILVIDEDKAIISSIKQIFPQCNQLICEWHKEQNIKKNLSHLNKFQEAVLPNLFIY
mgnify:CR=1 FL=1